MHNISNVKSPKIVEETKGKLLKLIKDAKLPANEPKKISDEDIEEMINKLSDIK